MSFFCVLAWVMNLFLCCFPSWRNHLLFQGPPRCSPLKQFFPSRLPKQLLVEVISHQAWPPLQTQKRSLLAKYQPWSIMSKPVYGDTVPPLSVPVKPNRETNMEPNQLWDTSSSKFTINFLPLLIVYCRLLFLASLSRFLACCSYFLERRATKIWNPTRIEKEVPTQPFLGGVAEIWRFPEMRVPLIKHPFLGTHSSGRLHFRNDIPVLVHGFLLCTESLEPLRSQPQCAKAKGQVQEPYPSPKVTSPNNVLLGEIEGPVWYTIYHQLPVVIRGFLNPSINQPTNGKRTPHSEAFSINPIAHSEK